MTPDSSINNPPSREFSDRNHQNRTKNSSSSSKLPFVIGCIVTSIGILVTISVGSWDITNHLLKTPETFSSRFV